jgi:MFS superfamily sulfate permease-like transporter
MYANAGFFADTARELVDAADPPARVLVLDCEEIIGIDFTGVEEFEGLVEDMREREVEVRLARVRHITLERLRARGVIETLGDEQLFHRVEDAVSAGQS